MEQTCIVALERDLRSIAFTDHFDACPWVLPKEAELDHGSRVRSTPGGIVPEVLDVDGYLECIRACRQRFPRLRILTGVELGDPHRSYDESRSLLDRGDFEVIVGSVHSTSIAAGLVEVSAAYGAMPAFEVVREYLRDVRRLVERCEQVAVLAHIDYPLRSWPLAVPRPDLTAVERDYRAALRTLADARVALEINTTLPPDERIVHWWRDEGGELVSFGSDAHEPAHVGRGLRSAADVAHTAGFRPGDHPLGFWSSVSRPRSS